MKEVKEMKERYSYRVATNELREEAIRFHTERYLEVGFFQKGEHDPYERDSIYFTAVDEESQRVVGVSRLISKPMMQLPALKEFQIYDIQKAQLKQIGNKRYAEMSALTKLPKHDCTLGVLKACLQYSLDTNTQYWFCSLDERVYKYMCRMFQFPFKQIGEPRVYLGSTSIPCVLDIIETRQVLKEKKYKLYEYFYIPEALEVREAVEV